MKTPERLDVAEDDGLKTLRLFLRSFLPKLSAIAGRERRKQSPGGEEREERKDRERNWKRKEDQRE